MDGQTERRATWSDPAKAFLSYLRQTEDLDRSWTSRGLCRRYSDTPAWLNWMADYWEGSTKPTRSQREQTARATAALLICANCPVQFDCAFFGAASEAIAGIYGVRTTNLNHLRTFGRQHGHEALAELIDHGKASGQTADQFVTAVRVRLVAV